jgi:hypothetical protein
VLHMIEEDHDSYRRRFSFSAYATAKHRTGPGRSVENCSPNPRAIGSARAEHGRRADNPYPFTQAPPWLAPSIEASTPLSAARMDEASIRQNSQPSELRHRSAPREDSASAQEDTVFSVKSAVATDSPSPSAGTGGAETARLNRDVEHLPSDTRQRGCLELQEIPAASRLHARR